MEERRIADYFVVAGLPEDPEPFDDTTLSEGGNLKVKSLLIGQEKAESLLFFDQLFDSF